MNAADACFLVGKSGYPLPWNTSAYCAEAHSFRVQAFEVNGAMDRSTDGRQPMRHDKNRSPFGDRRHVLLDDPVAFAIERIRGFVEDQDPRLAQGVREQFAAFRLK